MSKILILGAGLFHGPIITQLVKAGFEVLACDRDAAAPSAGLAHRFKPIDVCDEKAVLQWARSERIDGIMPISDFGVRTAAFVAQSLGLPGLAIDAAERCVDKGRMRDAWHDAGLRQPDYKVVATFDQLRAAANAIGFPVVVKPTDSGGAGRGISIAFTADQIKDSYDHAAPFVKNDRFIVERFIDGTEMTVETVSLADGSVTVLAYSDKEKPALRTRVALSLNYPADPSIGDVDGALTLAVEAVRALGLGIGMGHVELIVNEQGAFLVELGARGGGGHVFHTLIAASSGIIAPVLCAKLLCGSTVSVPTPLKRGAVYRFFNPPVGILKAVHGIEQARKLPGVLDIDMVKKPGDLVGHLPNSLHRAGHVVTTGQSRRAAIEVANRACALVTFDVEPVAINELDPACATR